MSDALRQRLLQVFLAEHAEHLAALRGFLDTAQAGAYSAEALNEAFRRAHSLKGAARAVGIPAIEQLAHQLEALLAQVQQAERVLDQVACQMLQAGLDLSEDLLSAEVQGLPPPDPSAFEALASQFNAPHSEPIHLLEPPPASEPVTDRLPAPAAQPEASAAFREEQLRVSAGRLEALLATADQLQTEARRHQQLEQLSLQLNQELIALSQELQQVKHLPEPLARRLPGLRQLSFALQSGQQQHSWQLGQDVRELQGKVRALRMVPARDLFEVFPKMLRDLAREQGKQVQSQFKGLDIEVDRAVLQALKDPVMHILRNAVAHGIESPAERLRQGKDACGQITCTLTTRGHQLRIRIEDDGRGLDHVAIARARQTRGLADGSTGTEIIFAPGFSTTADADALSGRGMGLSVVAEAIQRLQGSLRLLPAKAQGLGFELKVPLHIATHHLLQISCRQHPFGLPSTAIRGLLRIQPDQIRKLESRRVLMLDQGPVHFVHLQELLYHSAPQFGAVIPVVLLSAAGQALALGVETLDTDCDVVLKPLSGPAGRLPLYLGAALAGNGTPLPVLDPATLLRLSQTQPQLAPVESAPPLAPLVLVVDDSITTRTLEQAILETHGYRVQVAVNGLEALDKLRHERFDLVISDVQMPEMDGFELLSAMKQDPELASLPIIMVTSLYEEADQRRGLQLGADAYLVKQEFEQGVLLDVIGQLL